jgi:hypothetical protein
MKEYFEMTWPEVLEEIIRNADKRYGPIGMLAWMVEPLEDPVFEGLTPRQILSDPLHRLLLEHSRTING